MNHHRPIARAPVLETDNFRPNERATCLFSQTFDLAPSILPQS